MDREEVMRRIRQGLIEPIGARVEVEFDNRQQVPLAFRYAGRPYEVLELIRSERRWPGQYHYLVRTVHGVYNLVLVRVDPGAGISPSMWRLDFRVADGEPDTATDLRGAPQTDMGSLGPGLALVRGELLGVVAFHGHLCPELAIGYRAALVARERLGFGRHGDGAQSVVMYSSSSAADAIQYLTGCTVGNGDLVVDEAGSPCFCFQNRKGRLLLKVLPGVLDKPAHVQAIEESLEQGRASPQDLALYRAEVDRLVRRILEAPDDALFAQVLLTGQ